MNKVPEVVLMVNEEEKRTNLEKGGETKEEFRNNNKRTSDKDLSWTTQ